MPTHEGFMQAICAEPDDDTHRLIYADWLEENGDPDRAEFIRVQIEIARLTESDSRMPSLRQREGELLARSGRTWRAELPAVEGITWAYFERGFMVAISAETVGAFDRHASALFAASPVQTLQVQIGTVRNTYEIAFRPRPRSLRRLLRGSRGEEIATLASSPHLARIKTLDLSGTTIEQPDAVSLAGSPNTGCLEGLLLSECDLRDSSLELLAASPVMERLKKLDLSCNFIGDAGIEALVGSPLVRNLTTLNLRGTDISTRAATALAESPHLERLKSLRIGVNRIAPEGKTRLLNRFGDAVILGLLGSASAPAFAEISLEEIRQQLQAKGLKLGQPEATRLVSVWPVTGRNSRP